jgi:hypothetical protein
LRTRGCRSAEESVAAADNEITYSANLKLCDELMEGFELLNQTGTVQIGQRFETVAARAQVTW